MNTEDIIQILSIVVSFFASQGLWNYINMKFNNSNNSNKLIMIITHYKILEIYKKSIEKGFIDYVDYKLVNELYEIYSKNGGNGIISHFIDQIKKLPLKNEKGES